MDERIVEIINYYSESHNIDFKLIEYPTEKHDKKNEILKDISAMANHLTDEEKYIIIGIKKIKGNELKFRDVENPVDQAEYQQFINSNIEPEINFEYNSLEFEGHQLSYFKIYNNTQRPYLLQKDVRNSMNPNKIDFKKGDGFIRKGTSTDKMTRNDFEKIYEKRFNGIDRKSDIRITPYVNELEEEEYSKIGVKFFDLKIENRSNTSINLDVEIVIFKNTDIYIVPKYEFEKQLAQNRGSMINPIINSAFAHIDFENHSDYLRVTTVKLRNQDSAIQIAQSDTDNEVFGKEILVYSEKKLSTIKAQITVRSDNFTDGALRQEVELEI